MKNDKLIPGAVLVIIGTLFLLDNFGYINFSWGSFFHLWPIIPIIAGVNLVFANNRSGTATAIKLAVLIAGMGLLIFNGLTHRTYRDSWSNWHFNRNNNDDFSIDDDNDSDSTDVKNTVTKGSGHYIENYKPGVQSAVLNINGGGASYNLNGVTNALFEASTREYNNQYVLKANTDSATETLDFDMNSEHHGVNFIFGGKHSNTAELRLNTNPEWEINVNAGATKLDFDLSPYKVQKLSLEGGAGSFNIKMGMPLAETNVEISTGVSEVKLNLPKNAACQITTDTGLSSKTFTGFDTKDDNTYETPGFDKATNKMYIKLSGGISDFKVRQY
jgi:hypothetical protein